MDRDLPLAKLVATSDAVARVSSRSEKTERLAELLAQVDPTRVGPVVAMLTGDTGTAPLGVGPSRLREARPDTAASESSLTLADVEESLARVASETGSGSVGRKVSGLRELLARATEEEQSFLLRLCFGELRQGALAGVMADAVAKAFSVSRASVRKAYMLSGDLAETAATAAHSGAGGLESVGLRVMRPVEPMLASTAESVAQALERHPRAILEWKLDGARIQVHKQGDEVRVFTRNLREVGNVVPEVVEATRRLGAREVVLDGEAIALKPDGRPEPFQVTMSRFGRGKAGRTSEIPISPFFFDLLFEDGETLVDHTLAERLARLRDLVPEEFRLPFLETEDVDSAQSFLDDARGRGHEGVMAKDPASRYQAGRRGKGWLKLKPANTLDLVILAVERGSGRRSGWLSNIHLGARDPETGGYVMLGKTFKGMTDDTLRWQTETFPRYVREQERHVLHLEPHFVAEIAFNEIQRSHRYSGGMALRFARLRGYRPDKQPEDADTIQTVRKIFETMTGETAP